MKTYYQPEFTYTFENQHPDFYSFFVFRSKKLAEKVFPDANILTFTGDDIEKPTYVDYMYDSPLYHVKYEPLQKALRQKLGIPIKIYGTIKPLKFGGHRVRLELSTTNLVTQTGIFKNFFEKAEIGNHGGGIVDGDGVVWFNLHIYYKHIKGGSNGIKFADAWYNTIDKTWQVEFVDDTE